VSWIFSKIVKGKENKRGRGTTGGYAREYKPLFKKEKQGKTNESWKGKGLRGKATALFILS
jgi:hypothetical protein